MLHPDHVAASYVLGGSRSRKMMRECPAHLAGGRVDSNRVAYPNFFASNVLCEHEHVLAHSTGPSTAK